MKAIEEKNREWQTQNSAFAARGGHPKRFQKAVWRVSAENWCFRRSGKKQRNSENRGINSGKHGKKSVKTRQNGILADG